MNEIYQKLNSFILTKCIFSPRTEVKGTFLHGEFVLFLKKSDFHQDLSVKNFYDLMRTWIEKTPEHRIDEKKISGIIYFEGLQVRGKVDNSKKTYNDYMKNKVKEYRYKVAASKGKIIIPKPRKESNITKLYTIDEPLSEEVSEWDQHKITIHNFEEWYQEFLNNIDINDTNKSFKILNHAYNNFRHAREIKPKNFNMKEYLVLESHIKDRLQFLDEKSNISESKKETLEKTKEQELDEENTYQDMYKLLVEKYKIFLDRWIPTSDDIEIMTWIMTIYPDESQQNHQIRFKLVKDILIDEYDKRNQ